MLKTIGKAALWIIGLLALAVACSVQADNQAAKRDEADTTRANALDAIAKADELSSRVQELEDRIDELENH